MTDAPTAPSPEPIVELRDVAAGYGTRLVLALDALTLARGERVFVAGPSGCGKSTLLGLVAGVLVPQRGTVRVLGEDLGRLPGAARDRFRGSHCGIVFQLFNLVPYLSVVDNVLLPVRFSPERRARVGAQARDEARRLLAALGLGALDADARGVATLSVGEQQRVAVARALLGRPELVIADEPTSALDADARGAFLELLLAECRAAGSTLLFVSHDAALGPLFDRRIDLPAQNRAGSPAA
jgi:putative ABC transport system ATP-binding protein